MLLLLAQMQLEMEILAVAPPMPQGLPTPLLALQLGPQGRLMRQAQLMLGERLPPQALAGLPPRMWVARRAASHQWPLAHPWLHSMLHTGWGHTHTLHNLRRQQNDQSVSRTFIKPQDLLTNMSTNSCLHSDTTHNPLEQRCTPAP